MFFYTLISSWRTPPPNLCPEGFGGRDRFHALPPRAGQESKAWPIKVHLHVFQATFMEVHGGNLTRVRPRESQSENFWLGLLGRRRLLLPLWLKGSMEAWGFRGPSLLPLAWEWSQISECVIQTPTSKVTNLPMNFAINSLSLSFFLSQLEVGFHLWNKSSSDYNTVAGGDKMSWSPITTRYFSKKAGKCYRSSAMGSLTPKKKKNGGGIWKKIPGRGTTRTPSWWMGGNCPDTWGRSRDREKHT